MPKVHAVGSGGSGRRGRGKRVSTALSEINVVPLVDVMLVLLIIFMVTAPMMQQGLQVNLPQSRRSTPVDAQPIYVTVASDFSRTQTVQIGEDKIPLAFLHERLKQTVLERTDKSVFLRTDGSVTAQEFMAVMDKLKEAGIEKVGFMTRPADGR